MNIVYDINSETGMMRLKFKKDLLNSLNSDSREAFEKYILPMLAMNNKFVLTGSLSLKLLGFEPMDSIGDFDFGLLDEFTEEDYNNLKSFFNLHDIAQGYNRDMFPEAPKYVFNPKAHMWQFSKSWDEEPDDVLKLSSKYFKMDIFNDEMLRKKDIIEIWYDDFPIHLVHPSITYSYRMRYALDPRSTTAYKYWERMDGFMKNAKSYYHNIKAIYKMVQRVYEHNINVEGNQEKILKLRALIDKRDHNIDEFFKQVFENTIDAFTLLQEKEHEQYRQTI